MALSYSRVPDAYDVFGRTQSYIVDVTLDDNYPTAGYVIYASDVGLKSLYGAQIIGGNAAAGAMKFSIVTPTGNLATTVNLKAYFPTGGATAAPTTLADPVAGTVTGGAITIAGSATGTIPAGATPVTSTSASPAVTVPAAGLTATQAAGGSGALTPGVAKELGSLGDLATITLRIQFFGR